MPKKRDLSIHKNKGFTLMDKTFSAYSDGAFSKIYSTPEEREGLGLYVDNRNECP